MNGIVPKPDLHQASLRQLLDQNVRQVRLHSAYRNHYQPRVLLQAPPKGGTSGRTCDPRHRLLEKIIYGLIDLREILLACNRRYLAHLSALDDFSAGVRALDRLTKPRSVEGKTIKGVNFFDPIDNALLRAFQNPRVNIAGVRRADLLPILDGLSASRLSRQLKRLREIGVIKKVDGTYRYYLTKIGRAATAALCRLTQSVIIPALA